MLDQALTLIGWVFQFALLLLSNKQACALVWYFKVIKTRSGRPGFQNQTDSVSALRCTKWLVFMNHTQLFQITLESSRVLPQIKGDNVFFIIIHALFVGCELNLLILIVFVWNCLKYWIKWCLCSYCVIIIIIIIFEFLQCKLEICRITCTCMFTKRNRFLLNYFSINFNNLTYCMLFD